MASTLRALRLSFGALVAVLAVFQFSENTADPDLWGHVVFGRQILETHVIPRREPFSWTAKGGTWINHEWLAEVALGAAHKLGGGPAILFLKMGIGLLTFALCLTMGAEGLEWPGRFVTWGLGALAVVEISYGFAARPQIFTALFLAVELWLLRRIYEGSKTWAWALPGLFVIWINFHGGALVGLALAGLAALTTTAQHAWQRKPSRVAGRLWLALAGSGVAMLCNPWGMGLLRWLIGSVLWRRPEIAEWNATPLGWDHAAFFLLMALAVFAWCFSRRPKVWWELAAWIALALLGLVAVRNAPLCAILTLALVPPHLADALQRFRGAMGKWETVGANPFCQKTAVALCCLGTAMAGIGTFILHKEHPLTMEVPRGQYPTAAIDFLREHKINGKTLIFFDWGEELIFELPACSPSIDGRLDTCYSRELIAAHWKVYNGDAADRNILDVDEADLALFPVNLAGTAELAKRPGWRVIYYDELAAILVHDPKKWESLQSGDFPKKGSNNATLGRAKFPDYNPRWP